MPWGRRVGPGRCASRIFTCPFSSLTPGGKIGDPSTVDVGPSIGEQIQGIRKGQLKGTEQTSGASAPGTRHESAIMLKGEEKAIGEGAGNGRRGKASTVRRGGLINTNGQFSLAGFSSFQGNFEEQLGEIAGRRGKASTVRRGVSTMGSFSMSAFQFQGNFEEQDSRAETDLGESMGSGSLRELLGEDGMSQLSPQSISTIKQVAGVVWAAHCKQSPKKSSPEETRASLTKAFRDLGEAATGSLSPSARAIAKAIIEKLVAKELPARGCPNAKAKESDVTKTSSTIDSTDAKWASNFSVVSSLKLHSAKCGKQLCCDVGNGIELCRKRDVLYSDIQHSQLNFGGREYGFLFHRPSYTMPANTRGRSWSMSMELTKATVCKKTGSRKQTCKSMKSCNPRSIFFHVVQSIQFQWLRRKDPWSQHLISSLNKCSFDPKHPCTPKLHPELKPEDGESHRNPIYAWCQKCTHNDFCYASGQKRKNGKQFDGIPYKKGREYSKSDPSGKKDHFSWDGAFMKHCPLELDLGKLSKEYKSYAMNPATIEEATNSLCALEFGRNFKFELHGERQAPRSLQSNGELPKFDFAPTGIPLNPMPKVETEGWVYAGCFRTLKSKGCLPGVDASSKVQGEYKYVEGSAGTRWYNDGKDNRKKNEGVWMCQQPDKPASNTCLIAPFASQGVYTRGKPWVRDVIKTCDKKSSVITAFGDAPHNSGHYCYKNKAYCDGGHGEAAKNVAYGKMGQGSEAQCRMPCGLGQSAHDCGNDFHPDLNRRPGTPSCLQSAMARSGGMQTLLQDKRVALCPMPGFLRIYAKGNWVSNKPNVNQTDIQRLHKFCAYQTDDLFDSRVCVGENCSPDNNKISSPQKRTDPTSCCQVRIQGDDATKKYCKRILKGSKMIAHCWVTVCQKDVSLISQHKKTAVDDVKGWQVAVRMRKNTLCESNAQFQQKCISQKVCGPDMLLVNGKMKKLSISKSVAGSGKQSTHMKLNGSSLPNTSIRLIMKQSEAICAIEGGVKSIGGSIHG